MESLRELRDGKGEFWHLDWLKPNLVPRKLLSCSRKVDWIQQRLISKCTDPLEQTLLGVTDPTLVSTDDIWTDTTGNNPQTYLLNLTILALLSVKSSGSIPSNWSLTAQQ